MHNYFKPSIIDGSLPTSFQKAPQISFTGEVNLAKEKKPRKLQASGTLPRGVDFSHPLAKEGGFWGIDKQSNTVVRLYDPTQEPINLTGVDDGQE